MSGLLFANSRWTCVKLRHRALPRGAAVTSSGLETGAEHLRCTDPQSLLLTRSNQMTGLLRLGLSLVNSVLVQEFTVSQER